MGGHDGRSPTCCEYCVVSLVLLVEGRGGWGSKGGADSPHQHMGCRDEEAQPAVSVLAFWEARKRVVGGGGGGGGGRVMSVVWDGGQQLPPADGLT